jgi:D-glycero-D-manno-heptose 1,7-bisphosphate phosphatase
VTTARPAVFLDRDGTIIHDAEYLGTPHGVRLLPGAAPAIARLNRQGVPVIVVTNQSGIARGLLTDDDYQRVRMRVDELLAAESARIDASYACPHHPDFSGACDCRKPGTLLYRQAAAEHALDLARSVFVGDRWRDVSPALALGGRGILVAGPSTPPADLVRAKREVEVVRSLDEAVDRVIAALVAQPASRAPRQ